MGVEVSSTLVVSAVEYVMTLVEYVATGVEVSSVHSSVLELAAALLVS